MLTNNIIYIKKTLMRGILVSLVLLTGACGPLSSSNAKNALQEKVPVYIKISKFDMGEVQKEKDHYAKANAWYEEEDHTYTASFNATLQATVPTFAEVKTVYNYRKEGKVVFIKPVLSVGDSVHISGDAVASMANTNDGKRMTVLIHTDKIIPKVGLSKEEFEGKDTEIIVVGESAEKEYFDGYKKFLENALVLFPGIWESKDGVKMFCFKDKNYRIEFADGSMFKRTWSLDNGIFTTKQSVYNATEKSEEYLIKITDKEWVSAYGNPDTMKGLVNEGGKFARYKKIKSSEALEKEQNAIEEKSKKAILGKWRYQGDYGQSVAIFLPNGTVQFEEKTPERRDVINTSNWQIKGDEISIVDKNQKSSVYKIIAIDDSKFHMERIRETPSDKGRSWKSDRIESFEEYGASQKKIQSKLEAFLVGEWDCGREDKKLVKDVSELRLYRGEVPTLRKIAVLNKDGTYKLNYYYVSSGDGSWGLVFTIEGTWKLDGDIFTETVNIDDGNAVKDKVYTSKVVMDAKRPSFDLISIGPRGNITYGRKK